MHHPTAVLASVAAFVVMTGSAGMAADRPPPAIFRVSANGVSRDEALKDAALVISQRCAANGYVILDNQIRPSPEGVFFYGPVTARCMA